MPRPKRDREKLPGYLCWTSMNARCRNPNTPFYHRYGGRGIKVCPQWQGRGGYELFIAHIGSRPSPEHDIDRIDNDGNYEPGNVRWALREVNMRNRGNYNHRLTCGGETKTITEWAQHLRCSKEVLARRIKLGWTEEETVSTPVQRTSCDFEEPAEGSAMSLLSALEVGESVVLRCSRQRVQQISVKLGRRFTCVLKDMQNKVVKVTRISLEGSWSLAKLRARSKATA